MARQTLKDANGNVIGYIDTESDGRQVLKDRNGNVNGYFDPKSNATKNTNGNVVGYGNLLVTLLR